MKAFINRALYWNWVFWNKSVLEDSRKELRAAGTVIGNLYGQINRERSLTEALSKKLAHVNKEHKELKMVHAASCSSRGQLEERVRMLDTLNKEACARATELLAEVVHLKGESA